jgi:hypothetical protein
VGRRKARILGLLIAVIALAVWARSHSPGRAGAVVIVAVLLALGVPRVLRAIVGAAIVVGVLLNTELLFGPPTVWLVHRSGDATAIVAATVALTTFNLAVISLMHLLGWGPAVRDTVGRVLTIVPGQSPGLERAARAIAAVNRRLLAAPRAAGLALASVVVGPPTAVAAFDASRLEAVGSCLVYAVFTATALAGVAHWLP